MEFLVTSKLSPFLRLDHTQWQLQKQTSMYYKEVKLDFDARFLQASMCLLQEVSYARTSKLKSRGPILRVTSSETRSVCIVVGLV